MPRCKHCGVYITPDPDLEGYLAVEPDTCDDCWGLDCIEPDYYSDADQGL
jgi:hypothetical protein